MIVGTKQAALLLSKPLSEISPKRLAWAFGCAKKDSDEEVVLYRMLVEKLRGTP